MKKLCKLFFPITVLILSFSGCPTPKAEDSTEDVERIEHYDNSPSTGDVMNPRRNS